METELRNYQWENFAQKTRKLRNLIGKFRVRFGQISPILTREAQIATPERTLLFQKAAAGLNVSLQKISRKFSELEKRVKNFGDSGLTQEMSRMGTEISALSGEFSVMCISASLQEAANNSSLIGFVDEENFWSTLRL
jgi:hypothetical protein